MTKATIELSLVGLMLCAAACGGSDRAMQPAVPASMTTTTGATTAAAPAVPTETPRAPLDGNDFLPPTPETTTGAPSEAPSMSAEATDSSPSSRHATMPLTDAEIASVADAAGLGLRQHAREAMLRARSQRVRQLAHLLLNDRGQARLAHVESVQALTPADNATSAGLRLSQTRVTESLRASPDDAFDRAYVNAEVNELRELTQLLDDKLIPQAQGLELKQVLQELRTSAARNLGMATDIQSTILK